MITIADDIRIEFKFGILAGILACLRVTSEFLFGLRETGQYAGYSAGVFLFIVYFFALRKWKIERGGGFLTIRQGMRSGILMSMIAAVIFSIFMIGYSSFVDKSFLEKNVDLIRVELERQDKPAGEIRDALDYMRDISSFPKQTVFILAGVMLEGAIVSFIVSWFLRKPPPVVDVI